MIRFYLVCLPYWIFVDYIFVQLNLTYLPANNLRRISTMYVRGYLQGSENGRVATIDTKVDYFLGVDRDWIECKDRQLWVEIDKTYTVTCIFKSANRTHKTYN